MAFRFVGSAFAVAIVCGAGCGSRVGNPASGETIALSTSAIQGGALDTSAHNFAVAVCGGLIMQNQYQCELLCSGALIAPNLVVSARHCVDNVLGDVSVDGGESGIDCSTTTFGAPLFPADQYFITTDPNIYDPAANWYQVARIVTPTATEFCGNDLSLLVLGTDVPSSEVPVLVTPEIWYPIDAAQYSSTETAIGYGLDGAGDSGEMSSGVRRILEDIDLACIPGDPALPCAGSGPSGPSSNEFAAGNGPCEGDSGSSAYEQRNFDEGNWVSLGVLSRGGAEGNTCEGSVYTQLYPWQSLLVSTAEEAAKSGGYPPPAWTTNPFDAALPDSGGAKSGESASEEGGAKSPSTAALGASCSTESSCSSHVCVSATGVGGFVCSTKCGATTKCPGGYDCAEGYCFVAPKESSVDTPPANPGRGCSVGRVRATTTSANERANETIGWAGVAAVFVWSERRRRRLLPGRRARL